MNVKMTTNSQLSTIKFRNKLSKHPEQEQNHRYGDHLEGYKLGGGRGIMEENVWGLRSIIGRYELTGG